MRRWVGILAGILISCHIGAAFAQITPGGGGGGGSSGAVFGPTAAGSPAGNPPIIIGGTADGTSTGTVGNLKVLGGLGFINCANCSGSGVSEADGGAFVAGSTLFAASGGFFQTDPTGHAVSTGQYGLFQMTANRALFTNLRNAAGTEIGTALTPMQVSLENTGANATALKVDGSAVTQPVSGTFWQATQPVSGTFWQTTQPVSVASLPLPTGAATQTTLASILTNLGSPFQAGGSIGNTAFGATQSGTWTVQPGNTANTTAWLVTGTGGTFPATQSGTWNITNISGTVSLPTGAATAAKQPSLGTAGAASANVLTVQGVASMTPLVVDGSGSTQPISGTVTANLGTLNGVALAANQTNASQKTQIVDGSGNVVSTTSNNLNTQCANCVTTADEAAFTGGTSSFVGSGGFFQTTPTSNALTSGQQGMLQMTANRAAFVNLRNSSGGEIGTVGTPIRMDPTGSTVQPVSGTFFQSTQPVSAASLPLPALASTSTKQSDGSQKTQIVDGSGNVIASTANALNVNCSAGCSGGSGGTSSTYGAAFPTVGTAIGLSNGTNMVAASADGSGNLKIAGAVTNAGTFATQAAQSGTWNVTNISGTVSLPTGAATAANQTSVQTTTGSTAPASANYTGVNSSGTLVGLIQASNSAAINVSTATTTQLVALSSGKKIYVTSYDVIAGGAGNITFEYGTGTNCGTGTTILTGAYNLIAQAGISKGNGLGPVLVIPASNALCVLTSAAVQMSGSVAYTQF